MAETIKMYLMGCDDLWAYYGDTGLRGIARCEGGGAEIAVGSGPEEEEIFTVLRAAVMAFYAVSSPWNNGPIAEVRITDEGWRLNLLDSSVQSREDIVKEVVLAATTTNELTPAMRQFFEEEAGVVGMTYDFENHTDAGHTFQSLLCGDEVTLVNESGYTARVRTWSSPVASYHRIGGCLWALFALRSNEENQR